MDPLFPVVPEDLAGLTPDELTALVGEIRSTLDSLRKGELDVSERFTDLNDEQRAAKILEEATVAAAAAKRISDELKARSGAEENFQSDLDRLANEAGVEDEPAAEGEGEGEGEGAATTSTSTSFEVETETETPAAEPAAEPAEEAAVVAAADPPRRIAIPRAPERHRPATVKQHSGPALVAAAGIPDVREGIPFESNLDLARAIIRKREAATSTARGVSENVVVASVDYSENFSDERKLDNDLGNDMAKIEAIVGKDAMGVNPDTGEDTLLAAGGICAPATPLYEVYGYSVASRPVRDALPGYNAVRGGIRYTPGVSISIIDDAIADFTAAEDLAGGSLYIKPCQVIECPDIVEVQVGLITKCLQFGNLVSRAWPELVARWMAEASAAHARRGETLLLDAMGASAITKNVTQAAVYGATSTIITSHVYAAAAMRSRHRMDPNTRFRVFLPEWLPDMLAVDLAHQQFGRFDITREGIGALLRRYGIEPTWYLDGGTGMGQVYGAQSDGGAALLSFPNTVVSYLFPEGTFVFLDQATLDLGIVRDSALNETNDYRVFMETFEALGAPGTEAYEITTTLCENGTVAAPSTPFSC